MSHPLQHPFYPKLTYLLPFLLPPRHPVGSNPVRVGPSFPARPGGVERNWNICGVSQIPLGQRDRNRTLSEKERERILLRNAAWYRRTGPKVRNQAGTMVFMSVQQAIQHAIQQGWTSYLQAGAETPLGRYGPAELGWAYTYDPNMYNARSQDPVADLTGGQDAARDRMDQLGVVPRGNADSDASQGSSTGAAAPIHLNNNGTAVSSFHEGFNPPTEAPTEGGRVSGLR